MNCNNPTHHDLKVTPWHATFMRQTFPVSTGRGGIGIKRGEGDGITPVGRFAIPRWYFRADRIRGMDHWEPMTSGLGWCDAVGHPNYNQPITRPFSASHEIMRRGDPQYNIVGIIDYNLNPIHPSGGSAIFLHAWRKPRHPTAGCVALAPQTLDFVARNWRPDSRIMITGYP